MESLPGELRLEICSHLPHSDLLSLSRTCGSLAAAAKPFLFETLTFHGDEEASGHHVLLRHPRDRNNVGRFKPVELASLKATVDEVVELDILKYASTLQYSPKIYFNDFWDLYRDWVEERAESAHELTFEDMDGTMSDEWESDDEWGHVGVRRLAEARQARPEKERVIITKAERYWRTKAAEQEQKEYANHDALVRLFRRMPCLDRLQIMEWSCVHELRRHGIEGEIDEEVECQFSDAEVLNLHLATLSDALHEAEIGGIKHLFLPTVYGRSIQSKSYAIQCLFSGLTSLSFDLHDPTEMLGDYDEQPPSFGRLIRCARYTLEKLEFSNLFAYNIHGPRPGEHLLEKLWGYASGSGTAALVFPRLKHLELISLILYTPSLITFLKAQPALEKAVFRHIYLPTRGYGWTDVAAALPPSCHSLHLDHCGGQTTPRDGPDPPPNSNITCSEIKRFYPYQHPFPETCGWRLSKSHLEREAANDATTHYQPQRIRIADQIDAAQSSLLRGESDAGASLVASLGELLKQSSKLDRRTATRMGKIEEMIKRLDYADYERL